MSSSKSLSTMAVAIASPVLLTLGNTLPVVKSSLGYTWVTAGNFGSAVYLLAVVLLAANLMQDRMRPDVAVRVNAVTALVTVAVFAYGVSVVASGIGYFRYQTAFDMPGWAATNQDAFWNTLAGFGYRLRNLYEAWGPSVTVNDNLVYQDAINSLDVDQLRQLIHAGGISAFWYPWGIAGFVASAVLQGRLLLQSYRCRTRLSPAPASA